MPISKLEFTPTPQILAEFRLQRQSTAVRSARRFYPLALVAISVFLVSRLLNEESAWALTVEFLAVLVGGIILWRYGDENPRLGAITLVASLGIVCLFSLMQFGPLMGLGFLAFAWLIGMSSLLGHGFVAATLTVFGVVLVGTLTQLGWEPDWGVSMGLRDWVRTTVTVTVMSFAGATVVERMNAELLRAWARESAAQQERAEAERALLQAQRLESIAKLAGGVAHDFNNALAVLVGGIEALHGTDNEDDRQVLLRNMGQAARGAVATTRQLLSLSRQGLEPGKPANPTSALEALIPNLKRLFPETIEIRAAMEETAHVPLSSGDLEQVVLNLCLNARDAMPGGGVIEISCQSRDEYVIIQVHDSGEGMDEATLAQATSAFFTTKKTGTGLGLAMVVDTLDSVAGTVEFDSRPGEGTTITLVLPALILADQPAIQGQAEPASPSTAGSHHVLLVEDNKMVRDMYREILALDGYTVTPLETVDQAVAAIDAQGAGNAFDILVSDAVLPDGEPSRAIRRFREQGWKPVLVCSGYIDSEELLQGLTHSDYEFLQKPFSNTTLLNTVGNLLQQESPESA